MRSSLILLTASGLSLGLAACKEKNDGFVPPRVGTQIAWKYVSEDGVDDDLVTVVATGPDFAIYKQTLEKSYYVEFSGIGYSNCEDDQPSYQDRKAVLSAWPLTVGTEIAWYDDKITIDKEDETQLGTESEPVFWMTQDYADEDTDNDVFAVSPRYGMALELKWPGDGHDYVVSIEPPSAEAREIQDGYFILNGVDVTALDMCTGLLTETTRVKPLGDED